MGVKSLSFPTRQYLEGLAIKVKHVLEAESALSAMSE